LLVVAIFLYLLIVVVSWALYRSVGDMHATPAGDLLFFSLVTQSTVGYGTTIPTSGAAQVVATAQILTGIAYLALVPAVVLARLLTPGARAVSFSRFAIFDPEVGQFRFRFVNESWLTASRAHVHVSAPIEVKRVGSQGGSITRFFRLELVRSELWLLRTHVPIVVESQPPAAGPDGVPQATATVVKGSPSLLREGRSLQVVLELQFPIGASQIVEERFSYERVVCGSHLAMEVPGNSARDWDRFDQVVDFPDSFPHDMAPCLATCLFRFECTLVNRVGVEKADPVRALE
jgi:hypothetical protein